MKAYKAVFLNDNDESTVERIVGGNDIAHAARKAKEYEESSKTECVSLASTDEVIL